MITHYSNTSTSIFRRCTYRFHKQYGGPKISENTSSGMRLGSAGHAALNAFYSGKSFQESLDWAWEAFDAKDEQDGEEFEKLRATLLFYWAATGSDHWKIIETEKEVRVGKVMGIFDLIAEEPNGRRIIVDHKFQKSRNVSHLPTDTQVSFYLLLARELELGVSGLLYNVIPVGSDKPEYPLRRFCTRSDKFLDSFKRDLETQVQVMEAFQADPKPFRNFTRDCVWDCGIRELCLQEMEQQWQK